MVAWGGIELLLKPTIRAPLEFSSLDFLHFLLHQRAIAPSCLLALFLKPNANKSYHAAAVFLPALISVVAGPTIFCRQNTRTHLGVD